MSQHRISVAVATCGRPEALKTCLDAIASQTRRPDQIIVVDQHPLAETRKIISQMDIPIDYFEMARTGLSASRNRALEAATGTFLAVTDEDCFPSAGWVKALLEGFADPALPAAVTGPILPPPGEPPEGMRSLSLRLSRESRLYSARVPPWQVGSGANFAARVEALRDIGGWNCKLGVGTPGMAGEDIDIIDRVLRAGGSILYHGDAVMHHAWQTQERRRDTRWSYGYGIGAASGLRLGERDAFGWKMLKNYCGMHVRGLAHDVKSGEWASVRERLTSLGALLPSAIYGLRLGRSHR